ncbi:alpha/beta hydrolase family protein [Kitasatospora sp. NPDC058218]|uniref:alpha/beta hydrolase family protein n=1 Tax=Kitasatospora sp. NPDC058218 TaxID=3346385 RepID=UPI0036D7EAAC
MDHMRTAVRAIAAALAVPLLLPLAGVEAAVAAPAPPGAAAPRSAPAGLPRPTGPHPVGRDTLHLVDENRQDPWAPEAGARQLMLSLYYPARPGTGGPTPYLTSEEARLLLQDTPGAANAERLTTLHTWARTGARPAPGRYPLILLSPGFGLPRATLTGLAEELGSRGYVVAAIDHAYEAAGITLPDGRTLPCAICDDPLHKSPLVTAGRATDVSFVLDRLTGRHPAWRYAALIDPRRTAMAGHSIGGAATATAMAADPRIRAGADLDGTFVPSITPGGLDGRPFLMLGEEGGVNDPTWRESWAALDDWKRWVRVAGSDHGSFCDEPVLLARAGMPQSADLSPTRAEEITRAYVAAFFDLHLKGVRQPLLDRPSPAYPEVTVQRPDRRPSPRVPA